MIKDLTGRRFGKLTVVSFSHSIKKPTYYVYYWNCKCDCGKEVIKTRANLIDGRSTNCGCLTKSKIAEARTTHNLSKHPLYNVWRGMKKRCYCKNAHSYKYYGEKGIIVCDEWMGKDGFINFYNWAILSGYKAGLSIDRIDNNKAYEPSNCRWADWYTQENNRSINKFISYNGEMHTIAEWARIKGIGQDALRRRLNVYKWSIEKALETPVGKGNYGKRVCT